MSIQNDIDALSCTGREYNSPLDFVPIVNVALVLSGVRGAARLETTDAAFFQAMRELMQRRYPHLKLVHWNAYNAEPVLMDASDPQNVKDMDQIVHALRDGGSDKACEPIVTDPTGRMPVPRQRDGQRVGLGRVHQPVRRVRGRVEHDGRRGFRVQQDGPWRRPGDGARAHRRQDEAAVAGAGQRRPQGRQVLAGIEPGVGRPGDLALLPGGGQAARPQPALRGDRGRDLKKNT